MRAYRVPYPPKEISLAGISFPDLSSALLYLKPWTVDFPERKVSYKIVACKEADLPRCIEEVRKAVDYHAIGQEPALLEIRLPKAN